MLITNIEEYEVFSNCLEMLCFCVIIYIYIHRFNNVIINAFCGK